MAIHPLGILNVDGSERDRKIIDASFAQIDSLGTQLWTGYSFSWMACMRARAGEADRAVQYLEDYVRSFVLRNGFHCNGEQTRKGLSSFHYRPFTLEGNFAAAQAVHEMLLQSWGDKIRVFPAVPQKWKDLSFESWRAEGGFVVDAEMKDRQTRKIRIEATAGGPLRLVSPWETARVRWENTGKKKTLHPGKDGVLTIATQRGDVLVLDQAEN
jgi:alpha-L-fucosidase 2